ncbi:hypothetical protein DICSQDRAFT_137105 [Dichomitus squalens LYAD-421 SS1]|uniref:F-box domain-containing protein n=1 Tax=Dichomitus squalens (strain LYAD-421) TaxID=732165 RepID=R7SYR4_DICSQ|nr:uncharacterized protein DICSQDRAFT_137105 [Dichomitus squalens LYAD-421 SS1]EJF60885.1 hypothetical protein DICSQDRAFT_137105 [Dichomitus squalens LYAD-421 SS1]
MPFLSRRKTNGAAHSTQPSAPLQDSANVPRTSKSTSKSGTGTPAPASIYSVEKPPSLRRRHIHFPSSFNKLAAKLTSARPPSAGITNVPVRNGGGGGGPLAYWRSRSPSPAPSLDIRMPAGLGRRASELGEREEFFEQYVDQQQQQQQQQQWEREQQPRPERKRSISLPAAAQAARWRAANSSSNSAAPSPVEPQPPQPTPKQPPLARISTELLASVFAYAPRSDVLALAQVSTRWSQAALRALYDDLDLRDIDDARVEQCIASLASRRPLASLVRRFACRDLPPPDAGSSLSVVALAIALTNMDQLRALALPRFDLRLLRHTTFSLHALTLHCTSLAADDFHALVAWLGGHPALRTLALPQLVMPVLPPAPLRPVDGSKAPSRPHTPHTPDTPTHDPSPSSGSGSDTPAPALFPLGLLPQLREYDGPVAIAAALVPGRPLERVRIPIQSTLYDGLRPSALMSALACARETLRTVTIQPASAKIDQRTIERVVMSAGAELGDFVETLEVHWVLDDEVSGPCSVRRAACSSLFPGACRPRCCCSLSTSIGRGFCIFARPCMRPFLARSIFSRARCGAWHAASPPVPHPPSAHPCVANPIPASRTPSPRREPHRRASPPPPPPHPRFPPPFSPSRTVR